MSTDKEDILLSLLNSNQQLLIEPVLLEGLS